MSRQIHAARAPLWTLAGLVFLTGCGGASADVSWADVSGAGVSGGGASAKGFASHNVASHSVASPSAASHTAAALCTDSDAQSSDAQHARGGAVVPVWYEFDGPPLPRLIPADGDDTNAAAEPTVVLPPAESNGATQPEPAELDDAPEPPSTRYDVGVRYGSDAAAAEDDSSSIAAERPPIASEPTVERAAPPLAASAPRVEVRRLPPVAEPSPAEPVADAAASPGVEAPAPAPIRAPVMEIVEQSAAEPSYENRYQRPSEIFADEADPVSRFERLPPVEEATLRVESADETITRPISSAPHLAPAATRTVPARPEPTPALPYSAAPTAVAPPSAAPPAYEAGWFLPPPVVLPPADANPGVEREPVFAARPPRPSDMDLINERAGECVRVGNELAHRGALYSAQAEFAAALRIIAQALDAQGSTTRHAEMLAAGLTALDESDDFLAGARSATATVDVIAVVAKHRTPVLKNASPDDLTPIAALQGYYTYAQEQLAAAVEDEPAASLALYGMGKVQTTLQATRTGSPADGPKAIALYQAALQVDERNYMAANELGVLLARCGRYDAARAALAHSASIAPHPAVWRNLAAVHERLGEFTLAANARAAAENSAHETAQSLGAAAVAQQPVVWLDPTTFAQSAQPQADLQRGQPAAPQAAPPQPQTSDKKSGWRWPLW